MVRIRRTFVGASLIFATLAGVAVGCSDSKPAGPSECQPSDPCDSEGTRSSDCDSHERCVKSVDKSGAPKFVCQLPAEAACAFNTDCAVPLVCAVDLQCRNECLVEADCVRAQRCIHGVCADEEEVTAEGDLVGAIPGAVGAGA